MPILRSLMMVLCVAALCGRALGAGEAPTTPAAAPPDPMMKVLREVNLDSVKLEDAMEFLQDAAPEFKAVVVREKGVRDDYPTIKVRLKNVTLGQIWSVLQAANPDLEVQPVGQDEGPTPIYLIRVKAPSDLAEPEAAPLAVRVYPLGPLVDAMGAKAGNKEAGHGNDALDRVLSLIKATLAQVTGRAEPVLQVHEETRTLIFKGSAEQKAALEEVLAALPPDSSPEAAVMKESRQRETKLQDQVQREQDQSALRTRQLEAELAELHARLAEEDKNSLDRTTEAEKLKVRLEEQTDQLNLLKKRLADQTDELTKLKDAAGHQH